MSLIIAVTLVCAILIAIITMFDIAYLLANMSVLGWIIIAAVIAIIISHKNKIKKRKS